MAVIIKKGKMQVVKGFLFLIIFLISSCHSLQTSKANNVQVEHYRTESENYTYLVLKSYELDQGEKLLPGTFIINKIIYQSTNLKPCVLNVKPGNFHIQAGFVGKEWEEKSIKVNEGDSIVVKFFLKQQDVDLID